MVTSILVVLLLVVAGGGYAAWHYSQGQYYVGTDGNEVIIYRGVNQRVLGMSLSHVYQRTGIPMSHVPANDVTQVRSTITAASLADAQKTVSNIRQQYTCQQYDTAYANSLAHKPKPVTKTRKVGRKTVKTTTTPAYRAAPAYTPRAATPQGAPG